ncbi:MAG: CotH kinase family protein [Chloroflexota bacterium]|nr:CotH kinase family protein [Chloroflexota bacterium]
MRAFSALCVMMMKFLKLPAVVAQLILLGRALLLGLLLVLLTTGVSAAQTAEPGILITEVLAANTRTVADDRGRYADWIELHNPTDTPISLAGYTMTDDPDEPDKWRLPFTTLAPGAFLVVWASGDNRATSAGWHTSFQLSRGGEYVGLFGPDGQAVDTVTFGTQEADVSLGRLDTVSDQWLAFPLPTPGAANMTGARAINLPPPVLITPDIGRFSGPVTVHLESPVPESVVYYSLDGSDPTVDGHEYMAPLEVTETTVLRAVALQDGVPVSAVTMATYLVRAGTGLPVVSLVTEPAHLWDATTGIFTHPEERGRTWERPVTVQWLAPEGEPGFSVGAGLRIHGNTSRTASKQSFRLYFRGGYGPRQLAYPLFGAEPGQTYDQLVLRAGPTGRWSCHEGQSCSFGEVVYVRDQLVRDLHGAMGHVAARGRWVEVYLNGTYWGLYNLTERIDESFLATHFDHDYWDLPHTEEHVPWAAFVDWITSTDLSEATQYEQAVQQLDIENFTSFIILELWAGDTDWGAGNPYVARMQYGPDPRWRLFVWDAEWTFGLLHGIDAIRDIAFSQTIIDVGANGPLIPIFDNLLATPRYQAYFTSQVEQHLAGALATESVRDRLAALTAELRPAIAAEAARWLPEQEPAAVAQWETVLQQIADALDANAQRLRHLSNPETLRRLLPNFLALDESAPLLPATRIALLVDHLAALEPGDEAIVAHLEARSATVNVIGTHDDNPHDPVQVAGSHDLLLMSSSVRELDIAARYAQTTTPVIFWEPQLLEATQLARRGGTRAEQVNIRIVDREHPIMARLPEGQHLRVVLRPDTLSVAYPPSGPGVHVLARHVIGGDAALMVVEVGDELINGQPAKARTVFWFGHHNTFHWSTSRAVRLFDRAVDWALGLPSSDGA